jgi:hypothetical protein
MQFKLPDQSTEIFCFAVLNNTLIFLSMPYGYLGTIESKV